MLFGALFSSYVLKSHRRAALAAEGGLTLVDPQRPASHAEHRGADTSSIFTMVLLGASCKLDTCRASALDGPNTARCRLAGRP